MSKFKRLTVFICDFIRVFSAKIKIKPTTIVTANFKVTKAGRSVFTKPAYNWVKFRCPKIHCPITVLNNQVNP